MRAFVFIFVAIFFSVASAQTQIFDGRSLRPLKMSDVVQIIGPGTVVVFGEQHDHEGHHQNQRDLLVKLTQKKEIKHLSVGMELFDYTQQGLVDMFLEGKLSEESFLKAIQWSPQIPFYHYRFQVRIPYYRQGWTYALNLPRSITGKVSQGGLEALTSAEKKLLPPDFELGHADYFERFSATMKGHVPDEAIHKYFTAQSLWDDTMAWKVTEYHTNFFEQTLVILVGDFHAAWGGGLPARLRARGVNNLVVISQVSDVEQVKIDPKYGPRADFIFVSERLD